MVDLVKIVVIDRKVMECPEIKICNSESLCHNSKIVEVERLGNMLGRFSMSCAMPGNSDDRAFRLEVVEREPRCSGLKRILFGGIS
jgi:hypothetical protein